MMKKEKKNNSVAEQNIFISDAPIISEKEDVLGRVKFAHSLSKNILLHGDKKTIVIGLYGKWGFGKSSIINILLSYIRQTKEFPEETKPLIIEFNPWNFSEQDNLTSVFFNEIANNLSYVDKSKNAQKISDKLKLYGYFLTSANLISNALRYVIPLFLLVAGLLILGASYFPVLSIAAKTASIIFILLSLILTFSKKLLSSISDYLLQYSKLSEKTLKQLKDELNNLILERKKRLLIVIDDIDRLNTKEIKQIFQLIKLNADFNNTIYLLAFDRNIVEKSLEEQEGVSGKEYLEKIVQVSFDVPLVQKQKLYSYLFSQLDSIVKVVPEKIWDASRWGNLFHAGFKDMFSSLRDVKRYVNSLKFNFSLIQQGASFELNPIDFIGLEAIRVFTPEVYEAMRRENALLTHTSSGMSGRRNDEQERRQRIELIISKADENIRDSVKNIIFQLFPPVKGLFENMNYGSDWQDRWTKELRICSTELYDRFFILDVPEGELSQFEIDKLLEATASKDSFAQLLEEYLKNGKIRKVLSRLEDYTDTFNLEYALNIIIPLIDISDRLPDETVGFLDTGSDMHIMRVIYHYLKRIPDKAKRSAILKEAIKKSEGLFGCVMKISIEIQGIEKKSEYERLIEESEVDEFKKLCIEKIKKFADGGKLDRHPKLAYIIYDWIRWGGETEAKAFVSKLALTDEGLVSVVKGFLSQSQSYGMGDYVARTKWKINYKSLQEFIDINKAKDRLANLDTSKLNDREKLAIETFLKDFDKKDKNSDLD
jgi:predicted KAP-like P-loop ATPase